uniref:MFS domain-containing protein n=1 Tax=Mesocestoides corti TaxID=53468 RepID=A0A5K3EIB8_MESCO
MPKLPSGYAWLRSRFLHQSKERHQAFILLLTFAVYTLYHASRKPLSVVKTVFHKTCPPIPDKNSHWCQWKPFDGDNWSQLIGSLEYVYLVCYAFAMFPCGHLAERLNLRLFLSFGMAASGLTTILFGLGYYFNIHVFVFYFAVQILGGFVQATGWPAVVTILSNWFGKGRRGLVMGVWNAHTNFGNMLGSIIAGAFVNYQWGASFVVPGLLLVIAAYIVFLVLVEHPGSELNLVSSSTRTSEAHQKVVPGYYGDVKFIGLKVVLPVLPYNHCDAFNHHLFVWFLFTLHICFLQVIVVRCLFNGCILICCSCLPCLNWSIYSVNVVIRTFIVCFQTDSFRFKLQRTTHIIL